jgi:pimeloyl-ACP methyl ester carboxylesterase
MGGVVACWTAVDHGDRLDALVLEAPGAFRPDGPPPAGSPDELLRAMFAHPERLASPPEPPDPAVMERTWPLVMRLMGPAHDDELAAAIQEVATPTLVLFGTRDGVFPPEQGRTYKRLMPNCFLEYVYDAAHQIQHDRPEAFAAIVSEFAERQGAFLAVRETALVHR